MFITLSTGQRQQQTTIVPNSGKLPKVRLNLSRVHLTNGRTSFWCERILFGLLLRLDCKNVKLFVGPKKKLSLETFFGRRRNSMTGRRPRNHFRGHTSNITTTQSTLLGTVPSAKQCTILCVVPSQHSYQYLALYLTLC